MTVTAGTLITGTVDDTRTDNGVSVQIQESSGPPENMTVNFVFQNVTDADFLNINGYYDGSVAHNVKTHVYNYDTLAWDEITGNPQDMPSAGSEQSYQFALPADMTDYISGGEVQIQIKHESTGVTSHFLFIDRIELT